MVAKALADFEALRARHPSAALTELPSGAALVTLDFNMPQGWSEPRVVLRFIMPNGYAVAPPEGAELDRDVERDAWKAKGEVLTASSEKTLGKS